jgi:hypothetical protein
MPEPKLVSAYVSYAREVKSLMEQMPALEYPITSKSDLIKKLRGPDAIFKFEGKDYQVGIMVMFIHQNYFPILSGEAFCETLGALISEGPRRKFKRRRFRLFPKR